jgi:asparagine synthase (glutamine-hydrolysing)
MARWLQSDMKADVIEALSDENLSRHGLFDRTVVRRLLAEHFSGHEMHDKIIWSLMVFQKWFHTYIEKSAVR